MSNFLIVFRIAAGFIFLFLLPTCGGLELQASAVVLDKELSGVALTQRFEILEVEEGGIDFSEVVMGQHDGAFRPIATRHIRRFIPPSAIFLRAELLPGNMEGSILELDQQAIRVAEMQLRMGTTLSGLQASGTNVLPSDKPVAPGKTAFHIPQLQAPATIYLHLRPRHPINTSLRIYSTSDWQSIIRWNDMGFAIYILLMALVLATGLLLLRYRRESLYMLYICYVLTFGAGLLVIYGFAYRLVNLPNGDKAIPILITVSMAFLIEFFRVFFKTNGYWTRYLWIMRVLSAGYLVLTLITLVVQSLFLSALILRLAPFLLGSLTILAIVLRIKGLKIMDWFLLGWLMVGVGGIIYTAGMNGFLEIESRLKMAPLFGSLGEMIFFLLALNLHSNRQKALMEKALNEIRLQVADLEKMHLFVSSEGKISREFQPEETEPFLNRYLLNPLTVRESEVLAAISSGKTNREIAETLFISINTVKTHVLRIYSKLEVKNRTEAALKAMEMDLLPPKNELN